MSAVDLSLLPVPDIIDVPDFETLLAVRKARLVSLYPEEQQEAVARVLELESDPQVKLLQESVYREIILRQRVNEAAKAVMLAVSGNADLDNLVANFDVKRLTITPADNDAVPPVAAVMEDDDHLRQRAPDAFEGLSVAGPEEAYKFHSRSADGRVADASAVSPVPAAVTVTILSREGDGTASAELLQIVGKALSAEAVRPLGDRVTVQSAQITSYAVKATLHLFDGVAEAPCLAAATDSLNKYLSEQKRLGRSVRRQSYAAVLRVAGVDFVELAEPAQDFIFDASQSGNCTSVELDVAKDAQQEGGGNG